MSESSVNRRTFMKTAGLAWAGWSMMPQAMGEVASGRVLNHASFGAAGMGRSNIRQLLNTGKINLVAVAEVDERRLDFVRKTAPDARIYKDWRTLLEKEHTGLDSINVATPDHMHAPIAVTAMQLGLHAYVEKPLAQTLYETRRMTEIARERGLVTQMGTHFASRVYDRMVVQMIRDGVIGLVKEVHVFSHKTWGDMTPYPGTADDVPAGLDWDLWCGVGPKVDFIEGYYHPMEWRKRLAFGTGTLGDMGCHIFGPPFAALGLPPPLSVRSLGEPLANDRNWATDEKVEYIFPKTPYTEGEMFKMTWYDGALKPPEELYEAFGGKRRPKQGVFFVGTKGVLLAPHNAAPFLAPSERFEEYRFPRPEPRDHHGDFVNAITDKNVKPVSDFIDYAAPLTEIILLGTLATRFPHEMLRWDSKNLRFTNHAKANEFVRREYRKGWEIPGL